ncbi:MAG: NUDIX hydrolase [Hyphomonadaceae bacterium]
MSNDKPVFDPDDDPEQVSAAERAAAAQREPLGEDDLIRSEIPPAREIPVPRDAATLIMYRLDDNQPRILMGCRSAGHDFMPNKYVFPGGRVDEDDLLVPSLSELRPEEETAIRYRTERAPRAFPLTAVREVYEETGLIVGRAADIGRDVPADWAEYFGHGVAPCLHGFTFVGRAITPPMRHKRFDARFFMADAADCLIDDRPPVDGRELADLRWFTLAEAAALDLPNVTRFVISEIEARLRREALRPFFLRWEDGGHIRERI